MFKNSAVAAQRRDGRPAIGPRVTAIVMAMMAVIGMMAILPAVSASAAVPAASGGGCSGYITEFGVSFNACVNVSGGFTVNATSNVRGSSSSCEIQIDVLNESGSSVASTTLQPCSNGNHTGASVFELAGQYRGEACVYRGLSRFCLVSPPVSI